MADANHDYTVGEAIQLGLRLRDLGFYWFEEPVMPEPLGVFQQVRENNGRVRPPEGPGIGIALNEDFVTKYRVG